MAARVAENAYQLRKSGLSGAVRRPAPPFNVVGYPRRVVLRSCRVYPVVAWPLSGHSPAVTSPHNLVRFLCG
jgi:hypothetical protein